MKLYLIENFNNLSLIKIPDFDQNTYLNVFERTTRSITRTGYKLMLLTSQ